MAFIGACDERVGDKSRLKARASRICVAICPHDPWGLRPPPFSIHIKCDDLFKAGRACERVTGDRPRANTGSPFLPHPIADPWNLYQWVAADLFVVIAAGTAQFRLAPEWSFHQHSLPLLLSCSHCSPSARGSIATHLTRSRREPFRRWQGRLCLRRRSSSSQMEAPFTSGPSSDIRGQSEQSGALPAVAAIRLGTPPAGFGISQGPSGGRRASRSIHRESFAERSLTSGGVRGFLDDDLPLSPDVIGRIEDLDWLARGEFIDEIILALPDQRERTRYAAEVAFRNHLDIRAVPDLPPGPWPDADVEYIGEVPVITLHHEPVPRPALFFKRLLDFSGAALGLAVAAPVMAIIALLIRLESRGPIFYSAERTGAKGRRFRCHKFRSMVTNADHLKDDLRGRNQREGPIFKLWTIPESPVSAVFFGATASTSCRNCGTCCAAK